MKLLLIHSDYFEYEITKDTPVAEEVEEDLKKGKMEECLTAFITVESKDDVEKSLVANEASDEISEVMSKVNVDKVILYPYAHLSSDLSSPETAIEVLVKIENKLNEAGFEVKRSPFGWYKAFKIKCKGHPLSELSREIDIEEIIKSKEVKLSDEERTKEADASERDVESEYYILTPNGEEHLIEPKEIEPQSIATGDPALDQYIISEEKESTESEEPPSVKSMKRLEIADYESASDPGNLKFYPKGNLIFELLKEWAREIAVNEFGAMQIDTPIIYDWDQPDIREQGQSFHERHYRVLPPGEDKKLVLRFAGDFGLFRMLKDSIISYKNLPTRIYEFSKSFRYENRGELTGLKRLRAFHMPDIHSFTKNLDSGWEEYQKLYKKYSDLAEGIGIEYAIVFRVVDDFYEDNKNKILEMLRYSDKPAFIEVMSERRHYWVVKHEFQGIDSVGGNAQLSTVQLDVEDAERYDITFTDNQGMEKGCIILHSSIGSIERWMYEILESAHKMDKPTLPIWLSPVQLRILPVSDDNIDYAQRLGRKLDEHRCNVRSDIDDRSLSLGKKIREAEKEWIPYIVVVGDREEKSGKLNVRIRNGENREVKLDELIKMVERKTESMPFRELPLPDRLSVRPKFVG